MIKPHSSKDARRHTLSLPILFVLLFLSPLHASLRLTIVYDPGQSNFTAQQQQIIEDAADFWMKVITGYRDGVSRELEIEVSSFEQPFGPIVGTPFGAASGSLRRIQSELVSDAPNNLNGIFLYSSGGSLRLNIHPDALPLDQGVVLHEIGHILGFGDLWEANELYNDGNSTTPTLLLRDADGNIVLIDRRVKDGGVIGEYRGSNALREYRAEFDPTADFIPVELDNAPGSAHLHWNESTDFVGNAENPGPETDPGDEIVVPRAISGPHLGMSFDEELMTSRRLNGSLFLSRTTLGAFQDLGFTVDFDALEATAPNLARVTNITIEGQDVVIQAVLPEGRTYQLTENADLEGSWDSVIGFESINGASFEQTLRLAGFYNSGRLTHFFRFE